MNLIFKYDSKQKTRDNLASVADTSKQLFLFFFFFLKHIETKLPEATSRYEVHAP